VRELGQGLQDNLRDYADEATNLLRDTGEELRNALSDQAHGQAKQPSHQGRHGNGADGEAGYRQAKLAHRLDDRPHVRSPAGSSLYRIAWLTSGHVSASAGLSDQVTVRYQKNPSHPIGGATTHA